MNWGRSGGKQCAELEEWISAYADGQTARSDSEAVEAHLADCARCGALLRRFRRTRGLLRLASGDSWTPPDLRLLIAHSIARDQRPRRRPLWPISLAACLVLALVVGAFSLGGASPWRSTSLGTAPQAASAATIAVSPPSAAACAHAYGRVLARCLGMSWVLLRTALAEERPDHRVGARPAKPAIRPPLLLERHLLTPAVLSMVAKGGGIEGITNRGQHGPIPM